MLCSVYTLYLYIYIYNKYLFYVEYYGFVVRKYCTFCCVLIYKYQRPNGHINVAKQACLYDPNIYNIMFCPHNVYNNIIFSLILTIVKYADILRFIFLQRVLV